ncbi:MAG: hypothetical protein ABIJ97_11675 [Bacteroidota bacterium]
MLQSKTFWTGISSIIAGVGGIVSKTMSPIEGGQLIITGLGLIFIRDAIRTK